MKRLLALVLLSASTALAQTTITCTIPPPTFVNDSLSFPTTLTCTLPASTGGGLPTTWTVDTEGDLTVPSLTTALLNLTGGTNYAAGQYIVNIDASGNVTYAPYSGGAGTPGPPGPQGIQGIQGIPGPQGPPGTGSSGTTPAYTVSVPAFTNVAPGQTAYASWSIPGYTSPTTQVLVATPLSNPGNAWQPNYYGGTAGAIVIVWRNTATITQNFPATKVVVKVVN